MLKIAWELLPLLSMIVLYGVGGIGLMRVKTFDPVGAANYSLFLTAVAALLAVPVVIESLKRRDAVPLSRLRGPIVRVAWIVGLTTAYLLLMDLAGFLVLTPLYIAAMLFVLGTTKVRTLLFVPIATTAVLYVVFGLFFGVLLPPGLLDFFA